MKFFRYALFAMLIVVAPNTLVASVVVMQDSTRQMVKKAAQPSRKKAATTTATKSTAKTAAAKLATGVQDSTRRVIGMLGPSSGEKHLAYKGLGSPYDSLWPVKMPSPLPGSIMPARRIVAFYGNPQSKKMGILGEFEPDVMLAKLDTEVAEWNKLDPAHPVQPALHLIAIVAQGDPGKFGKYRLRMDSTLIEKVYGWAKKKNAILFLDVQVGHSTLQEELPWLKRFLVRPDVHLGIDPEFSMKGTSLAPGKKIGTFDAADVNYAIRFLADVVDEYKLPPKILIVHRFTKTGVTNISSIKTDPKVQFVMDMDGFGDPWLKRDSYYTYVKKDPVQFAGWKQFSKLKNDHPPTSRADILRLWPAPLYIQVQ
ncbi:MAG: hypothetical protein ABJB66_15570 [Gemmatimonadaceae bacterium]